MNIASFAGNVGNARFNTANTNDGPKSVLNFSLAVAKRQKGPDGKPLTLWVDCAVWGARADALQQYIIKGTKLSVSGSVDVDMFVKDDGQAVPKMTMMVNELTLQGSPSGNQGSAQQTQQQQGSGQAQQQNSQPQSQGSMPPPVDDFDDNIPL